MAAAKLTTAELAQELDTEPKVLRRFLRSKESPIEPVGKGNRYAIERRRLATLRKSYREWAKSHTRQVEAA